MQLSFSRGNSQCIGAFRFVEGQGWRDIGLGHEVTHDDGTVNEDFNRCEVSDLMRKSEFFNAKMWILRQKMKILLLKTDDSCTRKSWPDRTSVGSVCPCRLIQSH